MIDSMSTPRLVINMAQCTSCGDIVQSKYPHNFVSCKCRKISVDGGENYIRRLGVIECIKDMSLYEDDNFMEIRKYLKRGSRGEDGNQPLTWVNLCDMSDSYLDALIEYKESISETHDIYYAMYIKERELRCLM